MPVRPPNYVFDASLVPKTWLKFLSSSQIHLALWFTPFWGPRPPQIRAATYRTALSNAPRYSCFISRSRQKARPDIDRYFLMATAGSVGGCNGPRHRSGTASGGLPCLRPGKFHCGSRVTHRYVAPQLGALKGSLREDRFDAMKAQGLLPLGLIPELVLEPPKAMDLCQATRPVGLDNGWLF